MEEFDLLKADILSQSIVSGEGSLFDHHHISGLSNAVAGSDHEDLLRTASLRHRTSASRKNLSQIEPSLVIGHNGSSTDASKATTQPPHSNAPKGQSSTPTDLSKLRKLLKFEEAPKYLQFNSFITSGYRNILPTRLCIESIFWWTNETINIWSHIFGWFLFLALGFTDYTYLRNYGSSQDKLVAGILIVCFQACMVMSSIYHTFSCRSEKAYDCFLAFDLFGIALSLIAIYISGIYYAFWCQEVSTIAKKKRRTH